jgi:cytochrome c peroxidase
MNRTHWRSLAVLAVVSSVPTCKAAEPITLGKEPLTAGIAGEGSIDLPTIRNWLAEPRNHLPLQIELPEGLAAGKDAVWVPEDNPMTRAKIELGRQLYFDRRLSKGNQVSCADCHHPANAYGRSTQFGVGVEGQEGGRNSPVSFNRILSSIQFWDGRAASLEEQAKGPIANPIEMGNTHEAVVQMLKVNPVYREQFVKVFQREPNIDDVARAIATFERALVTGPSPYDANEPLRRFEESFAEQLEDMETFAEEQPEQVDRYRKLQIVAASRPMSESAKRGRELFFSAKSNCTACHVGANFSDEKYHNLGVGMDSDKPDLGRYVITKNEADKGAFKTPTLRNVAFSGPYMHDGSQKTLMEVVEWYAKGGHPNPYLSEKIRKLDLTQQDKEDLVAFMESLTGELPAVEEGRLPE